MYRKVYDNDLKIGVLFSDDYRKQLFLREIGVLSNMPVKTVQNALERLEKSKVLKSSVRGKNKYFSLNLENILAKHFVIEVELYKTMHFLSQYPQFGLFLKEMKSDETVIVFGSFAKLRNRKQSDVDLLIVGKAIELPRHVLPNKIHLTKLTESEFVKALRRKEALLIEIVKSHIILSNHSFYVGVMWSYYGEE